MGTTKTGRVLNTKGASGIASQFSVVHSNEGAYTKPIKGNCIRLKSGGHGQTGMGNQFDLKSYSFNTETWEDEYKEFLKCLKFRKDDEIKQHKGWKNTGPYRDPDGNSREFYEDLAKFLNKQEEQVQGNWIYSANEKTIKVSEGEKEIFILKSDQFGFSAPRLERDHPYDIYLDKPECDIKNVCEWIYYSRTIGGSFLWPSKIYDGYNGFRGGKKESSEMADEKYVKSPSTKQGKGMNSFHLEDREDLALLEIYLFYHRNDKKELWELAKLRIIDEGILGKWFDHFGSFETYVNFFRFNSFVCKDGKEYVPRSIITGEKLVSLNPKSKENKRLMIREETFDYPNINQKTFDNLVTWIKDRSWNMAPGNLNKSYERHYEGKQ